MAVVLVLTTASLAWSIHLTATEPTIAYFSPFTRAWELGLGATSLSVPRRSHASLRPQKSPWAGREWRRSVSRPSFLRPDAVPRLCRATADGGTALAIIAGMGADPLRLSVGRLLSLRPMLLIGDRSYAFYLWHWPVLILAGHYAGHTFSFSAKLVLVAGAFLLSCASYALVENPIHRRVRGRKATVLHRRGLHGRRARHRRGRPSPASTARERRFETARRPAPAPIPSDSGLRGVDRAGCASYRHRRRRGCPPRRADSLAASRPPSDGWGPPRKVRPVEATASDTTGARCHDRGLPPRRPLEPEGGRPHGRLARADVAARGSARWPDMTAGQSFRWCGSAARRRSGRAVSGATRATSGIAGRQ